jgi:hypothetical protein
MFSGLGKELTAEGMSFAEMRVQDVKNIFHVTKLKILIW